MSIDILKEQILALSREEKQAFIIDTLPALAKEAMQDPGFLMQLFPIFLGIVKESGLDINQLLQLAAMMGGNSTPAPKA